MVSANFMLTITYDKHTRKYLWKKWQKCMQAQDSHKWIIGEEKGKGGLTHYQCRCRLSMGKEDGFNWLKMMFPTAHIEECSDTWEYERKEGRFLCSEDRIDNLKTRYGKFRPEQERMIWNTLHQGDRGITVWYNPSGRIGKSWLTNALWERGLAYCVQVTDNVKSMVQDVASEYLSNGFRRILVLDFPREWKWKSDVYTAVERLKDGLIKDVRYGSRTVNIRGVCILVLCNTAPDVKRLSDDRWHVFTDGYVF